MLDNFFLELPMNQLFLYAIIVFVILYLNKLFKIKNQNQIIELQKQKSILESGYELKKTQYVTITDVFYTLEEYSYKSYSIPLDCEILEVTINGKYQRAILDVYFEVPEYYQIKNAYMFQNNKTKDIEETISNYDDCTTLGSCTSYYCTNTGENNVPELFWNNPTFHFEFTSLKTDTGIFWIDYEYDIDEED